MAEESQTLDTAMPCCGEDCGGILVAGSTGPALKSASSHEPTKILRLEPTIVDHDVLPGDSAAHPVLPAASPPVPARLPLALRL
jgi:hypothetical protein